MLGASEALTGEPIEMVATHHPAQGELNPYERVVHDAITGDATVFARQDYVEQAWRIVNPALKATSPVREYQNGTWGPAELDTFVRPPGGWHNPVPPDVQMATR